MLKQKKGITLIALVITIIVLLILAGVALNAIAGENGILSQAENAKISSEVGKEKDILELALSDAKIDNWENFNGYILSETLKEKIEKYESGNVTVEQIEDELVVTFPSGRSYNIENITPKENAIVDIIVSDYNKTIVDSAANYNNPIIPIGFKAVNDGASWDIVNDTVSGWNEGVVIEDELGNQFVWVPIDGVNVTYNKWCEVGISYVDVASEELPTGIIENEQINKYGGFWIGRYEAGRSDLDSVSEDTNDVDNGIELLIQHGAQPWNFISYENAKKVAENYMSNENVQSGLVTGTQWDSVMRWIQNSGKDVTGDSSDWGTYYYSTNTIVESGYSSTSEVLAVNGRYSIECYSPSTWQTGEYIHTLMPFSFNAIYTGTGVNPNAVANNIYDLAGNMIEITTEKSINGCIYRGGGYDGDSEGDIFEYPAAHRRDDTTVSEYDNIMTENGNCKGFRVVLFVK